jgi:predicted transcriptional regulator
MTKLEITHSLESLFARIQSWPLEMQEEVIDDLEAIVREFENPIELSPEEIADIEAGEAAAERGEFATEEEIARVFRLDR